jgi:4-hydroxybenzoate polyprenyltransferase
MLSSYTLLGHAFASNDWSGYQYDKEDPNKSHRPLIKGEISYNEIRISAVALLLISLILAALVSYLSMTIVGAIALLNYLYSGRKIFLKGVPGVSTAVHALGASLGFLLGYTYTAGISLQASLFSFYFGIVYAAGHLNHEVMDNESDNKSGIYTNASVLGKKNALTGSFILFSLSYFYIVILALTGILPGLLIAGVAVTFPLYAYFFFITIKGSLDYKAMIWFRQKYRIIFLLWGIYMSMAIILNKH